MKTKCSFKTFMFRRISYPGTLTLNNKYLKFKSENVYGEPIIESLFINNIKDIKLKKESSPDSCVKCYTMFLPFLLIKIDVFS